MRYDEGSMLYAKWLDKPLTETQRQKARESISLALDRLSDSGSTDDAGEVADALADAQAHLDAAKDALEAAFRGIES